MKKFNIKIAKNIHFNGQLSPLFCVSEAEKAQNFHQRLPNYKATPLHQLTSLAENFSLKNILVKDESYRFGLNAFKMLGGVYAIARLLCDEFKLDIDSLRL
ncbi:hypothetical protein ACLKMH_09845 [Psychromonas sp. KJ10-10]|uniref:hypothetical protein n=1 Tax=Psychromonas sp. KJ10-10 TaxID=3391823 RepID=UPI0039B41D78